MKLTSGPVADVGVPHGDGCRRGRVPADLMPRRVIADPGEIATLPLAMAPLRAEGNLALVIAGAPLLEGTLFYCRVVPRELGTRFTGCVSVVGGTAGGSGVTLDGGAGASGGKLLMDDDRILHGYGWFSDKNNML